MSRIEDTIDPNATFPFNAAERIFAQDLPPFLREMAQRNPEAERSKREFIYHFIAAELSDEGILEESDPDVASKTPVVRRTLKQWHGLWAEALGALTER